MKEIINWFFCDSTHYFVSSAVMFVVLSFLVGLFEGKIDEWLPSIFDDYNKEELPIIGKIVMTMLFCLAWPLLIILIAISLPCILGIYIRSRINNVKNRKKFKL